MRNVKTCSWIVGWDQPCGNMILGNDKYCLEHLNLRCVVCGAPAIIGDTNPLCGKKACINKLHGIQTDINDI